MHVSAERPVKCLVFEEREGCHLSDSAIDLVPTDKQIIRVRGLKAANSVTGRSWGWGTIRVRHD